MKGLAPIAANQAGQVMRILREDRLIESERVAQIVEIFRARVFAQHLLHGIAGHDVHEHKNHRENEPNCRKSNAETAWRFA